ncbi:DUF2339 domain-containing protein [Ottowia testudinis]|uniref:DUF2339 domain-containing protein n=1 Tax=Ottowia testudinis TaxID=2816950 RepID=A0A975H3V0_9BURK|nr:DUF2339 domain-containing protein [Ottowia testudinis]QTD45675.1 DUF2339 domain-containing protein [Ottowia testudinis]
MVVWGLIWGALFGALAGDFNVVLGALMGALAGWTLQRAVRSTVRAELAAAQRERAAVAAVAAEAPVPVQRDLREQHAPPATGFEDDADAAPAHAPSRDTLPSAMAPPPLAEPVAARASTSAAVTPPPPAFHDSFFDLEQVPSRPAAPASAARPPAPPSAFDQAIAAARGWLLGGNTIVRLGLVILFIGLSFLARYAAQAGLFPVELRLAVVGLAGIALLAVGFRQRLARPGFGTALQGAGVAVMYLTVFAAFRLYALAPQAVAFAFMVAVCAAGCALALLQNARALAFLAFAGGFAAPLLLSTGSGNHVALFGYYTLLNLAILFIAWRRAWHELNLLGFGATFGVATLWGVLSFSPRHYVSAQGFLLGFIAIFTAAALGYARQVRGRFGHVVDSTLIFGTSLAGFGLQAGLVRHIEYGTAFSALGFGAAYLLLAAMLARRAAEGYRVLGESLLAIGVGFATLAVPLALDARWTSAVWALEGAAAFWVGARQGRWMPRAFGLALQALAALLLMDALPWMARAAPIHPAFLGGVLIALAALACAWWLRQPLAHSASRWALGWAALEARLATPLFLYGFAFWCLAWGVQWHHLVPLLGGAAPTSLALSEPAAGWLTLLTLLLSAGAALAWARRSGWDVAAWPSRVTLPVLAIALLNQWSAGASVLDTPGWLIWPLALGLHVAFMRRNEAGVAPDSAWGGWLALQHPGTAWLGMALLGDALTRLIDRAGLWGTAWASITGLAAVVAVLVALTRWAGRAHRAAPRARLGWPLNPHAPGYYATAAWPLAALTLLGALGLAWTSPGNAAPLPYLPLLNPTDLMVALALGAVLLWRRVMLGAEPTPAAAPALARPGFWGVFGAVALVAASTVWLRIAHHFFGVAWTASALFGSFVVQTGYAILWTVIALVLMVAAHRRGLRGAWLAGAGLLGLVVLKLVLIDLSNSGGAERIVAFIGVGVLMLVVGYFAPLPPKAAREPRA